MDNTAPLRIKLTGTVTITKHGIQVAGFELHNANITPRDHAILAASWAIGQLQREMNKLIRGVDGGNINVD